MRDVVKGIQGPEFQNLDQLYLKQNKYFKKHYFENQQIIKYAENDVPNNIQPSQFCYVAPIRR